MAGSYSSTKKILKHGDRFSYRFTRRGKEFLYHNSAASTLHFLVAAAGSACVHNERCPLLIEEFVG